MALLFGLTPPAHLEAQYILSPVMSGLVLCARASLLGAGCTDMTMEGDYVGFKDPYARRT